MPDVGGDVGGTAADSLMDVDHKFISLKILSASGQCRILPLRQSHCSSRMDAQPPSYLSTRTLPSNPLELFSYKMDRESKLDHDSVVLETSMGDVQIELYYLHAPKVFIWSLTFRNLSDNASRHVKTSQNWPNEDTTTV